MVFKKIRIRKSQNSMTGMIMSLLLIIAIFTGSYLYVVDNIDNAGVTIDPKYTESYDNLTKAQTDLHDSVENIRQNFKINEADSTFQSAWNGLKGLGNILILPLEFINSGQTIYQSIIPTLSMFPDWVSPIIFTGILVFILFLVLKVLKGEPNL